MPGFVEKSFIYFLVFSGFRGFEIFMLFGQLRDFRIILCMLILFLEMRRLICQKICGATGAGILIFTFSKAGNVA